LPHVGQRSQEFGIARVTLPPVWSASGQLLRFKLRADFFVRGQISGTNAPGAQSLGSKFASVRMSQLGPLADQASRKPSDLTSDLRGFHGKTLRANKLHAACVPRNKQDRHYSNLPGNRPKPQSVAMQSRLRSHQFAARVFATSTLRSVSAPLEPLFARAILALTRWKSASPAIKASTTAGSNCWA